MKNKNERRTFINNKWKVILSNILQRATSYRSIIKSNSVSCSELLPPCSRLQMDAMLMTVQAGPAHADLCTHYHHYCQQLQSPVAILFHFYFVCVVHFRDFNVFVHPQFYNFRATNIKNCKSKSSKVLSNGGWWEMHKTSDQTTAASRVYSRN